MASPPRHASDDVDPAPLGQPLKMPFSGKSAPNRFLKAAMSEHLSSWDPTNPDASGVPSRELIHAYTRWGEGGIGNILTGNIMIDHRHLEGPANAIIPPDAPFEGDRFEAFKDMAAQAKKHGSLIVGQVSHPGRQTSEALVKDPISASDVKLEKAFLGQTFAKPHPATEEEIASITNGFAHAAEFLDKAGFDGLELHGAHGYLIAQFLSPSTNRRTDKYGGSLENRARLITEIAREIRRRTKPDFILGIKINSVEFQEGGFKSEEAKELCKILEESTFDFVELSGGTYENLNTAFSHQRESTVKREAFFIEFADLITPALKQTKVYVTGGFKTVGAMVAALDSVDGVGLGRPLCQEFPFCKGVLSGQIKGAIHQKIDPSDFGLTNMAAASQIRQVSMDQEPFDFSNEQNVTAFLTHIGAFMKKAEGEKGTGEGLLDLPITPRPYGAPAAST